MTKPFVGQGWAADIEPDGDAILCHLVEDDRWNEYDEDHPNLEYELEKAEYWNDPYEDIEENMYDKYGEPIF